MSENPPIEFAFPELRRWEKGAAPYIHVLESGKPGPTVMVAALTHGNEVSGAVVVDALLAAGLKPRKGPLIFSFNNIEAYHSFDAKTPFKSRLVDEDFNRTWGRLDQPATTVETRRAQVVKAFVERADLLLDLHSMHDDGVPLMLAGPLDKGVALARKVGTPVDIIRDAGHAAGMRMRDYGGFGDPHSLKTALLIECGQHWEKSSQDVALATTLSFLAALDVLDPAFSKLHPVEKVPRQRVITVTEAVTIETDNFTFAGPYTGLEMLGKKGTLIGYDGDRQVLTPYDDCVLIMPSRRLTRGTTAVRLGRYTG
jgi:predicted deacylase